MADAAAVAGGRVVRVLRPTLTVAAVIAVTWALIDAVREAGAVPLPRVTWLVASVALMLAGVLLAGAAWWRLLAGPSMRALLPSFAQAQLAKYVPGAIWQGVGQVLGAEQLGSARGRASAAFLVQLWTQLVAATCVGALLVLDRPPPAWTWLLVLGAVAGLATLARGALVRVLRVGAHLLRRDAADAGRQTPAQGDVLLATVLGGGTMVLGGWSYAVLLLGPRPQIEVWIVVAAFAAAWVAGFLVVPLPAGAGVREFVLLAALGSRFGAAGVLAAAVLHRVVTLVAEVLLATGTRLAAARNRAAERNHRADVEVDGSVVAGEEDDR